MQTKPSRVSFTVLAAALFFVIALEPSTSTPSVPDPLRSVPDIAAINDMNELAAWASGTSSLHALRPADLTAALRATTTSRPDTSRPDEEERTLALFPAAAERRFLEKLPFGSAIAEAAERNRVDGLLLAAVVETESRFAARAVSPRGARGLMQVLPTTADAYGVRDLFDPHANLDVGSRYLGSLLEQYHGDIELAVAAYNAGPATVARYGGVPPFPETRGFVRKVLARYAAHQLRLDAPAASASARLARQVSGPREAQRMAAF